jgi:hypothetical protein
VLFKKPGNRFGQLVVGAHDVEVGLLGRMLELVFLTDLGL